MNEIRKHVYTTAIYVRLDQLRKGGKFKMFENLLHVMNILKN